MYGEVSKNTPGDKTMVEENFSSENVPSSNWMKFMKVGDFVKGTFTGKHLKKGEGDFKDQMVYNVISAEATIDGKKPTETEFNIGISSTYINDRLKNIVPGQRIGVKFEKEIPAKVKGHHPAKSLLPNVFGMDPNYKGSEEFKSDIEF